MPNHSRTDQPSADLTSQPICQTQHGRQGFPCHQLVLGCEGHSGQPQVLSRVGHVPEGFQRLFLLRTEELMWGS